MRLLRLKQCHKLACTGLHLAVGRLTSAPAAVWPRGATKIEADISLNVKALRCPNVKDV